MPSFRLLTSPACDAEKSVLRQLVSAKTCAVEGRLIDGWTVGRRSNLACPRVSRTRKTES